MPRHRSVRVHTRLFAAIFIFFAAALVQAQVEHYVVGQHVQAGPGFSHPATILEVSPSSSRVHFDDGYMPDCWEPPYLIRAVPNQKAIDAAVKQGPRNGKYLILGYAGMMSQYNGYFVLNGGNYELFNPGGRSAGSGSYSFDASTATVKWKSGPFATQGWTGNQKFEVSREGKTHIIRLMPRTIGTNSTDSKS